MNTIDMESTNSKKPSVFSISRFQVAIFILLGTASLVVGKLSLLILDNGLTYAAKENFLDILYDLSQRNLTTRLTTSLAWFAIGSFLYLAIWALVVIAIDFYNDGVTSSNIFIHPRSFHQSSYWVAVLGRKLLQIASVVIFLFIVLLYVKLTTYCFVFSRLMGRALSLGENITLVVTAIIGTLMLLYICTVCLRFTFLKRRLF